MRFLVLSLSLFFALPVAAQTRHALVIGIDAYAEVTPLEKAVNDARAVEAALRDSGVETTLVTDPGQRAFVSAVEDFVTRLSPGDEAIFFFAGHGIEDAGQNFLLPADVPKGEGRLTVRAQSVALDTIIAAVQEQGARVAVFIIDACRDNPFAGGTRSIGGTRGLAPVREVAGTFVMFSAGQGEAALDRLPGGADADRNSVFTRVLLPRLVEPGLDLRQMATEVRREVRELAGKAGHSQFPAVYDQLVGEFTLIPAAATTAPQADPSTADPCTVARADWALVAKSTSEPTLRAFVTMHKDCPLMLALANDRISAITPHQPGAVQEPVPMAEPAAVQTPAVIEEPASTPPDTSAPDPAHAAFDLCKAAVDEVDVDDLAKNPALSQIIGDCRTALAHPTLSGDAKAYLGRALYADKSYDEAIKWFRQGADAGNTQAMNSIGVMLTYGRGVPKNDAEAARWYRKAAEAGNATGMTNVGLMLDSGQGMKRDPAEAARYLVLGLKNGNRGFLDGLARRNISREARIELQKALVAEGVYSGTIDGNLGPASKAAMEALLARAN